MMRKTLIATAMFSLFASTAQAAGPETAQPATDTNSTANAPVAKGHFWSREVHEAFKIQRELEKGASGSSNNSTASPLRAARSPNMTFHGGRIMPTAVTMNIFWGSSWATYAGDKMTGLDAWYQGYSNSNYSGTVTEYTGSNGAIGRSTTHLGHLVDTSVASGGGNTSAILSEVCKVISNNPDSSGNGYYAVYTDLKRGSAGYCAWHASGTCPGNATRLQFAFFWNLDGDAGCDPADTSGLHSQGLAALANVTGHELSEARTDPSTSTATGSPGWYDSSGSENGDKCAWTWGAPLLTFTNGTQWKVQGEWSNAAYTAGTGYANSSGQKGCLGGL
ncbi:hypothetical protein [Roseateles koreensis]|uniref:Uncharacterized protein n=1 Tax=Roseateles koreensis TaxID=2987526 RepID=A0ABT5KU50_9BURK|nr:hypothetical protein [Roseateles koreensis]MDC8786459.1 hypothetical protein [Roseateles koreensis]